MAEASECPKKYTLMLNAMLELRNKFSEHDSTGKGIDANADATIIPTIQFTAQPTWFKQRPHKMINN